MMYSRCFNFLEPYTKKVSYLEVLGGENEAKKTTKIVHGGSVLVGQFPWMK